MKKLIIIAKEMRIKHYIKNLLVFLPIIFSHNLFDGMLFIKSALMFLSFCFASSAVYIFNDIADLKSDAANPLKKKRPIAAGQITVASGRILCLLSLLACLGLSFSLPLECLLCVAVYIVINILYSVKIKNIPIADVSCIAAGFILRVLAGSFATGIRASDWLILVIMSLSFFMGFGKRKAEIDKEEARTVMRFYTKEFLNGCMYAMMSVSIVFYSLWAIDDKTIALLNSDKMIYTTFLVTLGLFRYMHITENSENGDPTEIIYTDKPLLLIITVFAVSVLALIYIF